MFSKAINLCSLFLCIGILLLTGCGSDTSPSADNSGGVAVSLQWGEGKSSAKRLEALPASIARVRITISGTGMTDMTSDFSAAAGSGTITGVPAGSGRTVRVQALDSTNVVKCEATVYNINVTAGNTTPVTITLTGCVRCTISGSVKDSSSNTAIKDATVSLSGDKSDVTFTDTNGNYQFTNIPEGTYTVTVSKSGTSYTFSSRPAVTISGSCPGSQDFTGTLASCPITGSVKTSSGAAFTGVTVNLTSSGSSTVLSSAVTDASGNYQVIAPSATGNYTLTLIKTYEGLNDVRQVSLTGTCPTTQNFQYTINCVVKGYVTNAGTGAGIQGVTVSIANAVTGTAFTDSTGTSVTATTGQSGYYEFASLWPEGSYTLTPTYLLGYSFTPVNQSVTISGGCPDYKNFTATSGKILGLFLR
jgi:hypothetical protein